MALLERNLGRVVVSVQNTPRPILRDIFRNRARKGSGNSWGELTMERKHAAEKWARGFVDLCVETQARPPSKEKGGWFGRNKKATAGESELLIPQQEMRRMRSERTHQRLVKAKDKGGKESTKWAGEAESHRAKAAAEAKVQAAREEALNKDREQSLARILSEERKTESAHFNYLRAEAVKRWEEKSPRHSDDCPF